MAHHRTSLAALLALASLLAACGEDPEPAFVPIPDQTPSRAARSADTHAANPAGDTERPAPPVRPGDLPAPPDVSAPPADAERTASGLASRVIRPGTGTRHPAATDTVEVQYSGWRAEDGELFDSSLTRGQPARFPLNRVIPGWTEGVQLMVEGEKRRFWIPGNLAYDGRPGAPQGMLVFDVELLRIL